MDIITSYNLHIHISPYLSVSACASAIEELDILISDAIMRREKYV